MRNNRQETSQRWEGGINTSDKRGGLGGGISVPCSSLTQNAI